ncbi:hypothetical protein FACS189459_2440 [Bacilli bacterium]|nr:hypothetical protein FACS189459_2440 [Bacilli bacterium]
MLKNIVDTCSFFDENAKVEDKAYDNKRKDSEYIPLNIKPKDYFDKEVKPFLANSELGADLGTQIEFNFNKHFYEPIVLRKSKDIAKDILEIDKEIRKLEEELYE